MKYLILIMDGAADYPVDKLNGKTPLQVAKKVNIDELAKKGRCGLLKTIPENFSTGSVVANLSILGYDPRKYFKGRGVLEAAAMRIELEKNDVAFRCNIINVSENKIASHSAGHLTSEESSELIKTLNEELGNEFIKFYSGVAYRNLLILKSPPHDFVGEDFRKLLPVETDKEGKETSILLKELINKSTEILENHPVNIKREKEGKLKGNMIWPWSGGRKPEMETFQERFKIGFEIIPVEGATGDYRTNYEGKAEKAIEGLKKFDLVYVHVEAPDEAGHEKNVDLKIKCIEDFDKRIVGNILKEIPKETVISVLPDHYTPVSSGKHTTEPVPFLIYRPGEKGDTVKKFDEISCEKGFYGLCEGTFFICKFLNKT